MEFISNKFQFAPKIIPISLPPVWFISRKSRDLRNKLEYDG